MSESITTTMSAHSHLISRVNIEPGNSLHPTIPGIGGQSARSSRYNINEKYVH